MPGKMNTDMKTIADVFGIGPVQATPGFVSDSRTGAVGRSGWKLISAPSPVMHSTNVGEGDLDGFGDVTWPVDAKAGGVRTGGSGGNGGKPRVDVR